MPPVKCKQCGKTFSSKNGLKIHVGRQHGGGTKAKQGRKKAVAGVTCTVCRRSFKLPMHLARHVAASHKKARRAKRARRRVVSAPRSARSTRLPGGLDVSALSIDELLSIKAAVDGKLGELVQKLRKIRV